MSLHFIIDGYNIIHHAAYISQRPKRAKEERFALLEFIRINKLCGSTRNKILIVFDGYPDPSILNRISKDMEVVFSKNEKADSKIKQFIERSVNPKNVVVVSDDKEIGFFAKSYACRWVKVEEFIQRKIKPINKKAEPLKPELSFSQINKINQELKELWLRQKKNQQIS
ncbi:MAG: NYN domain-containing protein [Candidatus Omnitrophica bacterium]|nr:NYN domain-containing protein [Candidatus Omnitrophota bacterium]